MTKNKKQVFDIMEHSDGGPFDRASYTGISFSKKEDAEIYIQKFFAPSERGYYFIQPRDVFKIYDSIEEYESSNPSSIVSKKIVEREEFKKSIKLPSPLIYKRKTFDDNGKRVVKKEEYCAVSFEELKEIIMWFDMSVKMAIESDLSNKTLTAHINPPNYNVEVSVSFDQYLALSELLNRTREQLDDMDKEIRGLMIKYDSKVEAEEFDEDENESE